MLTLDKRTLSPFLHPTLLTVGLYLLHHTTIIPQNPHLADPTRGSLLGFRNPLLSTLQRCVALRKRASGRTKPLKRFCLFF